MTFYMDDKLFREFIDEYGMPKDDVGKIEHYGMWLQKKLEIARAENRLLKEKSEEICHTFNISADEGSIQRIFNEVIKPALDHYENQRATKGENEYIYPFQKIGCAYCGGEFDFVHPTCEIPLVVGAAELTYRGWCMQCSCWSNIFISKYNEENNSAD